MDRLVVLGDVFPVIKPPDATVDINHESQPGAIRDEKGGGGTISSIMEEFLSFKLRLAIDEIISQDTHGHIQSCPGQRNGIRECSQWLERVKMGQSDTGSSLVDKPTLFALKKIGLHKQFKPNWI